MPLPSPIWIWKLWESEICRMAPPPHPASWADPSKKSHGWVWSIVPGTICLGGGLSLSSTIFLNSSWSRVEMMGLWGAISLKTIQLQVIQISQQMRRGRFLAFVGAANDHHVVQASLAFYPCHVHCVGMFKTTTTQRSIVKGQVRKRWSTNSVFSLHKLHQKGLCIPLLVKFSPVGVLFFKIDHMNTLVRGGRF